MMTDQNLFTLQTNNISKKSSINLQRLGVFSSFLLVFSLLIPNWIYLTGNLESIYGPFVYSLADFLYGPVWAFSLVSVIIALRERFGTITSHRLPLALITSIISAGMMILVSCLRASNRGYHLTYPELHLEESIVVLTVWTTIVQGVIGAGWHFLGWTLLLIASEGWTSNHLPKGLCILYFCGGFISLFVYAFPILEGATILLGVLWASWQGLYFWRSFSGK